MLRDKNRMQRCHIYCCLLHTHCLVLLHNTIYFSLKREQFAWQDQITVAKGTMLPAVPLSERKSKLFVAVCYLKNIILHKFTVKSKLKLCCISNISQTKIYFDLKWLKIHWPRKKDNISKGGSLICCCLTGLCPLCVECMIKCRLFTKN